MSWVVFDFGGVIGTRQPEEDVAAMAAAAGVTTAEFDRAYWPPRFAYDIGELSAETFWQDIAGRLGRSFTGPQIAELVRRDVASWSHLCEGTVRLIHDLRSAGQRLAVLSNMPREQAEVVAMMPVAGHFEHLLFSCDFRAGKPDPGCFSQALDRLGSPAGEVIFFDDRENNVGAAIEMGMRAIRFTSPQQARTMLAGIFRSDGLQPSRADDGTPGRPRLRPSKVLPSRS